VWALAFRGGPEYPKCRSRSSVLHSLITLGRLKAGTHDPNSCH